MILRRFGSRLFLQLLLVTASIVLLIQPGGFGNVDALFRYQATRSFWTAEPPVSESQVDVGFTLVGRNGQLQNWFGLGHAAWMLPFDVLGKGAAAAGEAALTITPESGDSLRRLLVASGSNLATALIAVASTYWLIVGLGFSQRTAGLTGLVLLIGTSFLHYAQVAQENNLLLALTILALALIRDSVNRNQTTGMVLAGLVMGAGLTVRLPFVFHIVSVLSVLMFWRLETTGPNGSGLRVLIQDGLRMSPGLCLGALADRIYQFSRFGTWTGTYMGVFREQSLARNPSLPKSYPFNIELIPGIKASVLSWDKFPLLYDPLLLPALLLPILLWRHLARPLRPMFLGSIFLILVSVAFHARYFYGDTGGSWGPRYVVTSVQLLIVVACPFVITSWKGLNLPIRGVLRSLLAASIAVQVSSVCFTSYLETVQRNGPDKTQSVVVMRLQNTISLLKPAGLSERVRGKATTRDATQNFAPFILSQKGQEPAKQTRLVQIWMAGMAAVCLQVLLFVFCLRRKLIPAASVHPMPSS